MVEALASHQFIQSSNPWHCTVYAGWVCCWLPSCSGSFSLFSLTTFQIPVLHMVVLHEDHLQCDDMVIRFFSTNNAICLPCLLHSRLGSCPTQIVQCFSSKFLNHPWTPKEAVLVTFFTSKTLHFSPLFCFQASWARDWTQKTTTAAMSEWAKWSG